MLTTGEMYNGTGRTVEDVGVVAGTEMVGVEHLGQYVFEMTRAAVERLGGESLVQGGEEEEMVVDGEEVGDEEMEGVEEDEDPLHEEVGPD